MEKKIEILILGHKAHIESIIGHVADECWHPKDEIHVRLRFDEAVGSTLGFGIILRVRRYTRDEFFEAVRLECEVQLQALVERDQIKRDENKVKKEREDALNQKVGEIKAMIGLE